MSVTAPPTPYKGLAPFQDTELDALLFFGREREREVVVANLIASRLTVLYGPSGVGKSSLLSAAVAHSLRTDQGAAVLVFSAWPDDPGAALAAALEDAVGFEGGGSLSATLSDATRAAEGGVYVILDQFEEYFLYHERDGSSDTFAQELADAICDPGLRVNFLLGLREDALAKLDLFKGRIPNLFSNYLRLDALDRRGGRAAILGPVERHNELTGERVEVEPELVDAVLDEVAAGRVDLGQAGRGGVAEDEGRIEAPYLQLVLERLWETERTRGSSVLRRDTLRELGGAESIVRSHFERALDALDPRDQEVAATVFDHLVTPSGSKIAHSPGDLAEYAAVSEAGLLPVLETLGRSRILRAVDGSDAGARWEIFHDVLADAVLAWRARHRADRAVARSERERRRARAIALGAVAALVVVAGIAVFAFVERGRARSDARRAHARELASAAVSQLGVDPRRSLALALRAAGLEPSNHAESVLRQALLAARLRRVLHVGSDVRFVAYSRDGARLLTGDHSGVVRIWRAADGAPVRTVRETGPLVAASYDPSGRRVVTAAGDHARLWYAASGRPLAKLRHPGMTAAFFDRSGQEVATAGSDGAVRLWRSRDGKLTRVLQVGGPVRLAALSPDGRRVVVATASKGRVRPRLLDARTGRLLRALPQRGITDIGFAPSGAMFATASADGSTRLWRSRDGAPVRVLDDGGKAIADFAFSPDGSLVATASSDGAVRVWDAATGERLFYFVGHTNPVSHVSFSPDGSLLVSTSSDRTARIWAVEGIELGRQVALLAGSREAVVSAAFSPDGRSLVTGSEGGEARIWDSSVEQRLGVLAREATTPTRVAYTAGGSRIADLARGTLRIRGARDGALVGSLQTDEIVSFSGNGRLVASAGPGGEVTVRRLPQGSSVTSFTSPSAVTSVGLDADGRDAVTADASGEIRIWDLAAHRAVGHFAAGASVRRVALSPDDDVVLTGSEDGTARLWSHDGKLLRVLRGHRTPVTDARFDPSGSRVVTAAEGQARNAIVWDVATGRGTVLVGHFGTVTAASFSSDGRWILTAGPISAAIWSARTGELLFYLRGPTDLLTDAEWSPTGYHVVTASRDGTVRTYTCELCRPLPALEAWARERLAVTTG